VCVERSLTTLIGPHRTPARRDMGEESVAPKGATQIIELLFIGVPFFLGRLQVFWVVRKTMMSETMAVVADISL
jgi:hypothetical protein